MRTKVMALLSENRDPLQGDQSSIELANYNIVEFDIKIAL